MKFLLLIDTAHKLRSAKSKISNKSIVVGIPGLNMYAFRAPPMLLDIPEGNTSIQGSLVGQICTTYQHTFEDDALSHDLGAGVRVEVTDTFLLCLGVNNVWQDFGGSCNDTTEIFSVRMDIGWKF